MSDLILTQHSRDLINDLVDKAESHGWASDSASSISAAQTEERLQKAVLQLQQHIAQLELQSKMLSCYQERELLLQDRIIQRKT